MRLTYLEHQSFMKVIDEQGVELARCDKLCDTDKWRLSFYVAGKPVERYVKAEDAGRMVKAVAVMCGGPGRVENNREVMQ